MKSHYEEDLGDFPTFSAEHIPVDSMVGAYRAESTDQWKAASGMIHYEEFHHFLMYQLLGSSMRS